MHICYKSITVFLISVLLFAGCTEPKDDGKITIACTTGIVADCIRNIVSDEVKVIALMGAGVDPHLYKASQGDIAKLSTADIIVYNGLHLEGKMAKMLENYSKQKPVFALGNYIPKEQLKRVDNTSDLVDPHIWFNPQVWMTGLQGVAEELSSQNPVLKDCQERFNAYNLKVEKLTHSLQSQLDSTLPVERRILITSHDAFEYFGDAFTFEVRGLQGISTAAEYGARDVKNMIDFIVQNQVKSVFVETSVSNKNLEAVIEGAGALNYELTIGGTLYSDALGTAGTSQGTYTGMLEANINTIIKGLQ
jgi:manganese/zinc/iron transport system substrate-binding protein|tara:strand:- start:485 stop:1402 length:918 start_codon:yes stop_codon:yes gene_type:complete